MNELSQIIAGEAGPISLCGLQAYIAVAWVFSRNPNMYGWGEANTHSNFVAEHWRDYPDPTHGGYFLFSKQDIELPEVQALIKNKDPTWGVYCKNGLGLYAYGKNNVSHLDRCCVH